MQISDDIYLGPAVISGTFVSESGNPSPMTTGIGPLGRVYVFDVVPLVLQTNGLATTANPGSGASFTLVAGTGVTAGTVANGTSGQFILDTPRSVTVTAAGVNTATYTITGYDVYGQLMTQTIAAPSTSTVSTTKCFKSVTSVTNANAAAGASGLTVGYGDQIGLPVRVASKDYLIQANFNATAVALSALTAAVLTSPATATTGDVRGSILLPTAADGAKRLVAAIALPALACGPNATRIGAVGVTQV